MCIFDKIVSGVVKSSIFEKTEHSLCFQDIHPRADHHELIIPKTHYENLGDFYLNASAEEQEDFFLLIKKRFLFHQSQNRAVKIVNRNGEKAGQEVPHLHYHLMAWDEK